jgi:hypothetical protein
MWGSIVIDPHTVHSLVPVPTAPTAPLPEKGQREQSLHRSLHLVTSALD